MNLLKLTLAFYFVVISLASYSQNDIPIPEENAIWTQLHYMPDKSQWTTLYEISGDTTLNEKIYKKIYEHAIQNENTVVNLFAFFRQEPENKMAFIIRHYFDEDDEKVLYNLNVNVGDTVNLPGLRWPSNDSETYLTSIDTVIINTNGELRKRYNFYANYWGVSIIEGVGEVNCPFGPYAIWIKKESPFYSPSELICLEVNEETVYGWSPTWCGELFTNISDVNTDYEFSILPNPTNGIVKIKYKLPDHLGPPELNIRNSFGQIIFSYKLNFSSREKILDLSHLNSGVYFYSVGDLAISGKLIIID